MLGVNFLPVYNGEIYEPPETGFSLVYSLREAVPLMAIAYLRGISDENSYTSSRIQLSEPPETGFSLVYSLREAVPLMAIAYLRGISDENSYTSSRIQLSEPPETRTRHTRLKKPLLYRMS